METDKQVEIDVGEWLIDNTIELLSLLNKRHDITNYQLWHNTPDIYYSTYKDNALEIIREEASKSLNINPEQLNLFINEEIINKVNSSLLKPKLH